MIWNMPAASFPEYAIFRYDNATHRPPLPQAEHRHTVSGVRPGPAPTLAQVMDEILGSS